MSTTVLNPDRFTEKPIAVLFDFDNTLYAYGPANEAGMLAVRAKAIKKTGVGSDEFDAAFAKARSDTKKQLGKTASSHSRLLYFQRTLELLGFRSQIQLSLEFEQAFWASYLATMELREGVIDFLDQLARANIRKVLITDLTTQIQFRKLIYLELDLRFEFIVTSEESGEDKPHRSGFDLALSKLNSQEDSSEANAYTGKIWMIGDNLKSDIEGAKNAVNATTLALKSEIGDHDSNASIDMIFESFEDLEQFVSDKGWDDIEDA